MTNRRAPNWHMLIADFALILFLSTTLGASRDNERASGEERAVQDAPPDSVYRQETDGASLSDWISMAKIDPRLRLTVRQSYVESERHAAIANLQNELSSLPSDVRNVRITVTPSDKTELSATLAYDCPHDELAYCLHP